LRERYAERLEDDALHVVLGLRFGEPSEFTCHAVPERRALSSMTP